MLVKADTSEGETINQARVCKSHSSSMLNFHDWPYVKAKSRFTNLCIQYLQDKTVKKLTEYQPPQMPDYIRTGLEISPGKFFAVHLERGMSEVLRELGVKERVVKSSSSLSNLDF